jgi:hypothetical protein
MTACIMSFTILCVMDHVGLKPIKPKQRVEMAANGAKDILKWTESSYNQDTFGLVGQSCATLLFG